MTDSDIARRVAEGLGLTADVGHERTYPYVAQCNQTDLEFLRERAQRIGYEVIVRARRWFRPRPIGIAAR